MLGFDLAVSDNLPALTSGDFAAADAGVRLFAGQGNEAVTYASQIRKVESLRHPTAFADYVRGLYVYGAKLVHPDRVYMVQHKTV